MQRTGLFFLFLCAVRLGWGQQSDTTARDTLFEKAPMDLVRFYFDDHYYLVDKDCEFKSIERVTQFIVSDNVFDGDFRDFDRDGTVVLTGHYDNGVRNGAFQAFHPNGSLKWEVTFVNNTPTGDWNYYYPDGKPMLTINYDDTHIKIMAFWDRRGRQRIKDGNGSYAFKMPFTFYNEYGFPFFERKGRVRNGFPRGYWTTHVVDDSGNRALLSEEVFDNNGVLKEGYNFFTDASYRTPLAFFPAGYFYTAERIMSKPCTFDDYSGFNTYLSDKFSAFLRHSPMLKNIEDEFMYVVELDERGTPTDVTLEEPLQTREVNHYLKMVLDEIPFYFPSLDQEGNAIADTLKVYGGLRINDAGQFHFHSFRIEREKQP